MSFSHFPHLWSLPRVPLLRGHSFTGLQIKQGSDLGSLKFEHCFGWPLSAASPVLRITLVLASSFSYGVRAAAQILEKSVCPKHAQDTADGQDVGSAAPSSRKTTGHCPQFPPNLGIVPGSSNGLGVAPGHWGLPSGSRSPSAASTAFHRASPALLLGSSCASRRDLRSCGELPMARSPCPSSEAAGTRLLRS